MDPRKLLRPPVLIGAGVVVVGATTFVVIRMFVQSLLLGLLVVLILALIVIVVVLVRQLQAAKAAEEIETTITRQANRDIERSVPGQAAELENMKAELLAAIESLKSSRVARRGGKAALSTLPWYMLLGPARGGKGTLVKCSELHFPLTDERSNPRSVRGVGGTRSLEWWLSEEAVLLEMPGRLLAHAEFEDNDDWFAFLDVLKKQRPAKPINGVLVVLGLDDVADRSEAEIDTLARRVRERIQELIERLGVVFPTYVVFTRADQIAGFTEFFSFLDAAGRHQAWGAAVPVARARAENASNLFDEEFGRLIAVTSERRIDRMAESTDAIPRARAFAFPLQLERVRGSMRRFIKSLFERAGAEGPLFRGFYLTSAAPEGLTVDRVLPPAARAVGVPVVADTAAPAGDGAWFVNELFTRAVFPDAALATESSGAARRRRNLRVLMFAGLGAVFVALTLLLSLLSCANGRLVGGTRKAALRVDETIGPDAPLISSLDALETLRQHVVVVDSLHTHGRPMWRTMGGYSGDVLDEPATRFYIDKTLSAVVDPALRQIEGRLRGMTDTRQGRFINYFYLFRAWRLLTDPGHLTPRDSRLVAAVVTDALSSRVTGPPAERDRFPSLVQHQIAFLASHAEETGRLAPLHHGLPDRDLEQRASARVRDTWDSSQFYELVIGDASRAGKALLYEDLVGAPGLLSGTYHVPAPYTLAGWEQQVRPRFVDFGELMQRDWVIDEAFRAAGATKPNLEGDLQRLYARDYSHHWVGFLNGVSARPPTDLGAASEMLKQALKDDSPLFETLRATHEQTGLDVDRESEMGAVRRDFAILDDFFAGESDVSHRGREMFGDLLSRIRRGKKQDLLDPSRSPKAKYQSLLQAAQQKVEEAAQSGATSATIKKLLEEGGDSPNPLRQLVAYTNDLAAQHPGQAGAEPTARVLAMMVTGARGAAGSGARANINNQWTLLVVGPFNKTLAGKYPFDGSGPDATFDDFQEFFRPGGTFWSFYENELKPYVTEDGTPTGEEGAAVVPESMRACVQQAYAIREAFFAGGAQKATLPFAVRALPPEHDPGLKVYRVTIDLGDQTQSYAMGAQVWQDLTWPGAEPALGAKVRADAGTIPVQPRGAEGVWGLFRLLDQGTFGTSEQGHPTVSWPLSAGNGRITVIYEIRGASAQHPFRPGFMRFALPPSL